MKPYYRKVEKPQFGKFEEEEAYEKLKECHRNIVVNDGFSEEYILVPVDSIMINAADTDEISVELVDEFLEYAQEHWDKDKKKIIADFVKKVEHERCLRKLDSRGEVVFDS